MLEQASRLHLWNGTRRTLATRRMWYGPRGSGQEPAGSETVPRMRERGDRPAQRFQARVDARGGRHLVDSPGRLSRCDPRGHLARERSSIQEAGSGDALKTAGASPNPTFVWNLVLSEMLRRDEQSRSDSKDSAKAEFPQFWIDIVDGMCNYVAFIITTNRLQITSSPPLHLMNEKLGASSY
jgi:hypothetical protein